MKRGAIPFHAMVYLLSMVSCVFGQEQLQEKVVRFTSERNTAVSRLVNRLQLVETAGYAPKSGQYFVKVYMAPKGEECETGGNLCEGVDLLVSVASPDLYGDNALYRFTGIQDWEFVRWSKYAEFDSRTSFTTFEVSMKYRDGYTIPECRNTISGDESKIAIYANPWEIWCEFRE